MKSIVLQNTIQTLGSNLSFIAKSVTDNPDYYVSHYKELPLNDKEKLCCIILRRKCWLSRIWSKLTPINKS